MATISSYTRYLPAILWSPPPVGFGMGTMLCPFEKILTGIKDGVVVTHGDGSVMTTVMQAVAGGPLPQTIRVAAGAGMQFRVGSSYTYAGATPEVIAVTAATANSLTAIIRQDHAAYQTIVNSSGIHPDIQSVIVGLAGLYGAWTTPPNTLDWLAQWVALQLDPAWDAYQRRSVLSKIVGIYAERGLKAGLDVFFDIYAIARQRPRVVVDNAGKLLFCKPQAGMIAPISTLVSQRPLVAPQCLAFDPSGTLLVGDLGDSTGTIKPALWRMSVAGEYDYAAGPPLQPQPYQPASAPVAIAVDPLNGGAYLLDFTVNFALYRLTAPQTGVVTLAGMPMPGQTGTITIGGTSYTLPQTGGTLAAQAAAWAVALGLTAPFPASYLATASGDTIVITPVSGVPGNDLTLVTTSSPGLGLTASGPAFGTSVVFANDTSLPTPLNLVWPTAMVVDAAGQPLVLDRGVAPSSMTPSAPVIAAVQITGAPPSYNGTVTSPVLGAITEPLSMLLRADGSLIVGDGADQYSAQPADLFAVDPTSWATTSLLGAVADNPLVAPTGIVEVDAQHLLVLDAGLRPYVQSSVWGFTAIIAQQAAIYGVDLSVAPPRISRISSMKDLVYPRAMVSDGNGTLYVCDSGLPDLAGYSAREWRSEPQQLAVVVHFQGIPGQAAFCATLSGTPTAGEQCTITLGATGFALPETAVTLTDQAAAWASQLNGDAGFASLYVALAMNTLLFIFPAAGTVAAGLAVSLASSADLTLAGGVLAQAIAVSGTPTTGQQDGLGIGAVTYLLNETGGATVEQQAALWCAVLNAMPGFSQSYSAAASGATMLIFDRAGNLGGNIPWGVSSSATMVLANTAPPLAVGTVTLSGSPTSGESGAISIGGSPPFPLPEMTGLSLAQQATAWCGALNTAFAGAYAASSAGAAFTLFAVAGTVAADVSLAVTSSAHLALAATSENRNRAQFLQSISDVMADEIPAHARWALQSEA